MILIGLRKCQSNMRRVTALDIHLPPRLGDVNIAVIFDSFPPN